MQGWMGRREGGKGPLDELVPPGEIYQNYLLRSVDRARRAHQSIEFIQKFSLFFFLFYADV